MRSSPLWLYEHISVVFLILSYAQQKTNGAIVPPPWSDPNNNPCATLPGGWQLLYWPPLKKCFKIFSMGYPCPDTMELSPIGSSSIKHTMQTAECRCPPGTALSAKTSQCYTLFDRGPCDIGHYFAPAIELPDRSAIPKKRMGVCKVPGVCFNGMIYWPRDGKCYTLHTRGPCAKGKLLTIGNNKIAECLCENKGDLAQFFYTEDKTCHEHFTRGPCEGSGNLFLPNGNCGCNVKLPHYHEQTDKCYEIGTIGPCPMGHSFIIPEPTDIERIYRAACQCKDGYTLWKDGLCYRMYTKGPCGPDEFLINSTDCIKNPCGKARLYFPEEQTCYRIGTQGPCNWQQVVVFDFTTRPSIDGISYNGVCGCSGIISNLDQQCSDDTSELNACDSTPGMVEINGHCYKLYSRGPCGPGQWLEPRKIVSRIDRRGAHCQCRPGYTKYDSDDGTIGCHAPSVGIARYLNGKHFKSYKFGFRRFITLLGDSK